MKEDLGC